jgi:ABC-type bacteriocin/lantibiotic exporter with double-glycine peptidase domain
MNTHPSTLEVSNGHGQAEPRAGHHSGPGPFDRFLILMRAESSDIWIVVVFAMISGLLGMTTPLAVEALVNTVAFGRFLQPVVVLSIMLLAFLLFRAAIQTFQTFVVEIIQRRLFARVAADLSYRLPRVRRDGISGHYPPELVNRFFDVVTVQKVTSGLLLDGISLVLNALVGMAVLAFYHPYLLAFDVALIVMLLVTLFVLGRGAVRTSTAESRTKYEMVAWLEDLARCPTTFRDEGSATFALHRADGIVAGYLTARRRHFRILLRQIIALLLIQALASTVLLAIGGVLVISGELSLGQLVAAELIVAVVVGAFAKMIKHIEGFYDLMAALDKLSHLLDLPMERQDGPTEPESPAPPSVRFDRVEFLDSTGHSIVDHVTFHVPASSSAAIVGSGSSGKSLLLDMLFGFRQPSAGSVTIDGRSPCDGRLGQSRKQIGFAHETEIFDGTLAENIHVGRVEISRSDIREALALAGLLRTVECFRDGLDTRLVPGHLVLSASQQRRLMLARAVAGRPGLLLIDGLLDSFADDEAAGMLVRLRNSPHKWTLILTTCRLQLATMLDQVINLSESPTAGVP